MQNIEELEENYDKNTIKTSCIAEKLRQIKEVLQVKVLI